LIVIGPENAEILAQVVTTTGPLGTLIAAAAYWLRGQLDEITRLKEGVAKLGETVARNGGRIEALSAAIGKEKGSDNAT
jgi:hypothetical protein